MDEDVSWKQKHMEIKVHFHRRMATPSPQQYAVADLHYWSLVEVIKEWISDPHTGAWFHLEPYKLLWKQSNKHKEVNIHSELYTSKVFHAEHQAL